MVDMTKVPEYFERKYAMYVLVALRLHGEMTKTELMTLDEGNEKTKFMRIQDAIETGLIDYRETGTNNAKVISLTPKGEDIADLAMRMAERFLTLDPERDGVGMEISELADGRATLKLDRPIRVVISNGGRLIRSLDMSIRGTGETPEEALRDFSGKAIAAYYRGEKGGSILAEHIDG